ncbi:unnamed protein product [Meloidogyne enterolobii]|uniref:Uncharacterized protein n=1 Tax=Meloidogyne enterolobii TaxID=390850 RepID=A0ACB0YMB6_MELEN
MSVEDNCDDVLDRFMAALNNYNRFLNSNDSSNAKGDYSIRNTNQNSEKLIKSNDSKGFPNDDQCVNNEIKYDEDDFNNTSI